MGLEVSKVLFIIWFVICLPAFALADPIIYTGGVKGGTTAFSVKPKVLTTDGGVSVWTALPDKNLVYAMIPRTLYESGVDDVNRNMGSADFSGVTGWYRDPATGKLTHYGANEISFEEHAGIYTIPLASATTNYVTESEDFTAWTKARVGITLYGTDPAGTEKAMFLREDGTAANTHRILLAIGAGVIAENTIVTYSVNAKAATRTWMQLLHKRYDTTLEPQAYFNTSDGTLGTNSGISSFVISGLINGFRRYSITFSSGSGAGTMQPEFSLADSDGGKSYNGDANSGLTIFGAMVSETPSAHPYLPTEGSAYVWAGNAGALTYSLNTMETALDGTVNGTVDSGTSLWGEQLGVELSAGNPTAGLLYKITADTGGDFYAGSVVDEYWVAVGTETLDGDSKAKHVLNAWDSGDGDGLEPPHGTLIQAVRHTYNRAEVPADATNHGYITTRNDSTGTLIYRYQNGISLVSFDGSTAAQAAIDIVAHSWSWLVLEVGKLNSNVSQFRLCEISGGLSCGAWADYDGDYSITGSNLHYFFSGFGYIHFGPTLIYRTHLDSTFYDQLGNGG